MNYSKDELKDSARKRIEAASNINQKEGAAYLCNFNLESIKFIENKYGSNKYEEYQDNQLYGIGQLYRYANEIDKNKPINFILPHIVNSHSLVWTKELASGLPIGCFSDFAYNNYSNACRQLKIDRKIFKIVHPLIKIYQDDSMSSKENRENKEFSNKAIYFPKHSTYSQESGFHNEIERLQKGLEKIRKNYSRLNLCIYHIDYEILKSRGEWEGYKKYFDTIYCCGSRYDPAFLMNFKNILSEHNVLISSGIGGHNIYGAMCRIKIVTIRELLCIEEGTDKMKEKRSDIRTRNQSSLESKSLLEAMLKATNEEGCCNRLLERFSMQYATIKESEIAQEILEKSRLLKETNLSKEFHNKIYPLVNGQG